MTPYPYGQSQCILKIVTHDYKQGERYTPKKLSEEEQVEAAEQFLFDIDDFVDPGKTALNVTYQDYHLVRFGNRNLLNRIVDKIFHVPLYVLKKVL